MAIPLKIIPHLLAQTLVLVGALNWGFIGVFRTDLVALLFRGYARTVYSAVGLAALYIILGRFV